MERMKKTGERNMNKKKLIKLSGIVFFVAEPL